VNQVLPEIPVLGDLVMNLYECHYDKIFAALSLFSPHSQPRQLTLTTPQFPATLDKHTLSRLSKSDLGQPVFSVWGRQELSRRVSVLSCRPCLLSDSGPWPFRLSSSLRLSFQARKRE
jgi:hypothetical protein